MSGTAARAGGAVAALVCFAVLARAQAVPALPLREGEATFHVRASIVRDFTGRAPVASARYSGSDLGAGTGSVEIRVAEMRTGVALRDRHLRGAMEADSFPTLRFDLARVEPGAVRGDTVEVVLAGRLTIHGTTREVRASGTVIRTPDSVAVRAGFPLDMRDYGIKPPVRLLGALRVAPDIAVGVRLLFAAALPARD